MREAQYYRKDGDKIRCMLCPRSCVLLEGQSGVCRGRKVIEGKLIAVNYAKCVSIALDPIEKKPLYHYNPGTHIVSLGPNTCNLNCTYCQNWEISQAEYSTRDIGVDELSATVMSHKPPQVAFTYSEPLMWYEYIMDFAVAAPEAKIVLVTNASICEEPFKEMLTHVDALNIDLKSIRQEFYHDICGGDLELVKRNIRNAFEAGVHLEITNLLIPGLNDTPAELNELASFVASIDKNIPVHISAYHPSYKLNIRATRKDEVKAACDIMAKHLNRVYAGNVSIPEYSQDSD